MKVVVTAYTAGVLLSFPGESQVCPVYELQKFMDYFSNYLSHGLLLGGAVFRVTMSFEPVLYFARVGGVDPTPPKL